MSNGNSSSSSGVGFWGLLQIVFIVLKMLGKITWPWIKVFLPTWISLGLVIIVLAIVFIMHMK